MRERKSRPRVHNACDSYPLFWTWLLATKSPCMRLFPLFLAWPLSKEELVPGSSDPSHNPHLFSTQPCTGVRDKDPSLFKCGASLFFEIGQNSDDSPYQLSLLLSKHPKGQLDPPVSGSHFFGQRRSVMSRFLDQRWSVGSPCWLRTPQNCILARWSNLGLAGRRPALA